MISILETFIEFGMYVTNGGVDRIGSLDYVHTVSFSLAFYIVLRPQGVRKQMKTLRKRHRVHG